MERRCLLAAVKLENMIGLYGSEAFLFICEQRTREGRFRKFNILRSLFGRNCEAATAVEWKTFNATSNETPSHQARRADFSLSLISSAILITLIIISDDYRSSKLRIIIK